MNNFMSPPAATQGYPSPDQEIMLDEPTRGVYQQRPLSAKTGAGGQSADLDGYMAGLQVQDRRQAQSQYADVSPSSTSSNLNPLVPSVPSPSYQNQAFDTTTSPTRPGQGGFAGNPSRMSSTSNSSQAEEDAFSSYPIQGQTQTPKSGSSSSPHGTSFSQSQSMSLSPEEEKMELANKRERDLQLDEERQKRGSTGSVRSEMTAIPSGASLYAGDGNNGNHDNTLDSLQDLRGSAASSPLGRDSRVQEVELISPPLMGSRQSSSGLAGLVAMSAVDDKGREPITFDEGLLRALCDSPVSTRVGC